MPDYASILRRSVSALPDPSPEMREAVYQRARAALARQLTAVEPPLSTREIEAQHQELEDSVVRLESEYAPQQDLGASFGEAAQKDDFLYTAPQPPPGHRRDAPEPISSEVTYRAAPPPAFEEEEEDFEEEEERGSRLPALIVLLCVVLVVVGAGAYVYAERERIMSFVGGGTETTEVTADSDTVPDSAAVDEPEKRADRLGGGGATDLEPQSPDPEPAAVVPDEAMAEPEPAAVEPEEQVPPTQDVASLAEDPAAPEDQPGTTLVEQRAIYYYQGSEGQAGQASEGTATWSQVTKEGRPAIQAVLRIAEQNVNVTVMIYKNYDATLPASHLVEVQFSGSLSESAIQRVPALVLKQTEQARGQPLAGAAVPVTNELFWIALSDDQDESVRNVQLLREGSWFDIPILFSDQTRALITFEKGIPGDKVFETVMASWTPA